MKTPLVSANQWVKENWFKAGLLIIGLIVAVAFYQSLVVIPRERDVSEKLDKKIESSKRDFSRSLCISSAESDWSSTFELNSDPVAGKEDEDIRTWRSAAIRESADKKLSDSKELCLKQYPQVN
jgi:hypothetical protein